MQVDEFYEHILGIEQPWEIADVRLDKPSPIVHVELTHESGIRWKCPCCERSLSTYDHGDERRWRHLDICQYETWLHARIPRVKCSEHGVRQVRVSWAEPDSRFTLLFEAPAIDVLESCEVVSAACKILGIGWEPAWNVIDRAVERGKARTRPHKMARVGADAKAFKKGHSYMTLVCDIDQATVEYVSHGRKKESLAGFFQGRSEA